MKPAGFWTVFFRAGGFFAVAFFLMLALILRSSDSGGESLLAAVAISLAAGVLFGLPMAAAYRSGGREFHFESEPEFRNRLAAAMKKERYQITQEAGARLVYRARGPLGLTIIVDVGESSATATGPLYALARLEKRVGKGQRGTNRG